MPCHVGVHSGGNLNEHAGLTMGGITMSMLESRISSAYQRACLAELCALKPGNVHIFADGHGMQVDDLRISAKVSAPFMGHPPWKFGDWKFRHQGKDVPQGKDVSQEKDVSQGNVGKRIALAQRATWQVTGCNTNLGILLLAAPIVQAAHQSGGKCKNREDFIRILHQVLHDLDAQDTRFTYRAIRMAAPAGLGSSPVYDVRAPSHAPLHARSHAPLCSQSHAPLHARSHAPLGVVMHSAQQRDGIARQYAQGFADIFNAEQHVLSNAVASHGDYGRAITTTYLDFLCRFPDTHVQRKYGTALASELQQQAQNITSKKNPPPSHNDLLAWDSTLKKRKINPGTSADFTVATLLVHFLSDIVIAEGG